MEVFKTIEGFPDYQISNLGYVLSTKRYKKGTVTKKLVTHKTSITLSHNGWTEEVYIHLLLAKYFKNETAYKQTEL